MTGLGNIVSFPSLFSLPIVQYEIERTETMIELKKLSKTFESASGSVEALRDIDLTINDGEIFGIIGLSGAGKSTLVRCINLLERPSSGQVIIDGRDMTALPKAELLKMRRSISMIFQGFNLLEQRSVLKNVCFPLEISGVKKQEARRRSEELLKLVGLEDKAEKYPAQLSGGQKQRVAIARALATNPKYLLCDEATSALDPNTTRSILELLRTINQTMGVTIIVITHEMKVIDQICDRVAVIDKSRIVECGKVSDIFTNPQSEIARNLILPQEHIAELNTAHRIRIIFDGNSAYEPVLANLILETRAAVNVLYAHTKEMNNMAYGQMVLQLPDDERAREKIYEHLQRRNITFKEEA